MHKYTVQANMYEEQKLYKGSDGGRDKVDNVYFLP